MKIAALILLLAAASPTSLQDQLNQIDHAAGRIKDLTARFEQRKLTALLTKPLISSGRVRSAGSVIRWDTQSPDPAVLYADRTTMCLYYPNQKLEEIYPIDKRLADLLNSPLPRLSAVKEHFTIEAAQPGDLTDLPDGRGGPTLALRLTPEDPIIAQHVRRVLVVLDINSGVTVAVRTVDPDGDRTDIIFSDVHVNTGLVEQSLGLAVPADTVISHPLDTAPPSDHASP